MDTFDTLLHGDLEDNELVLPGFGVVALGPYAPLFNSPVLVPFCDRKQLGPLSANLPSYRMRRDHVGAVFKLTQMILDRMPHMPKKYQCALLCLAIVHDLGHGPTSHLIEQFFKKNHHQFGLQQLELLKDVINSIGQRVCGCDIFEIVRYLFIAMDHPESVPEEYRTLHSIVSHAFGPDKIEYTASDRAATGLYAEHYLLSQPFQTLLNHLQWSMKYGFGVNIKRLHELIVQAERYVDNYSNIYFHRLSLISYRMVQRAIFETLAGKITDEEEYRLRVMTDAEFLVYLNSRIEPGSPSAEMMHGATLHGGYKTVGAFTYPEGTGMFHKVCDTHVSSLDDETIHALAQHTKTPESYVAFENAAADLFGLQSGELLITFPPTALTFEKKINKMNCALYPAKAHGEVQRLFTRLPQFKRDLLYRYKRSFAVAFHVRASLRESVSAVFPDLIRTIVSE